MAEHLGADVPATLGRQGGLKTAQLEEKRLRLEALYGVTALVAATTTLEALARGFVEQVAKVVHADGVAPRLVRRGQRKVMRCWYRPFCRRPRQPREHCLMAISAICGTSSAPLKRGSFRSARIIRRTCRIARRLASVRLFVCRCDITNRFVAKLIFLSRAHRSNIHPAGDARRKRGDEMQACRCSSRA